MNFIFTLNLLIKYNLNIKNKKKNFINYKYILHE
jgi:hypothetical protein